MASSLPVFRAVTLLFSLSLVAAASLSTTSDSLSTVARQSKIADLIKFGNNEFLAALFPDGESQSVETPIAIRYAYILGIALYDVMAACHPTALSFFGTKDDIESILCDPDMRALTQGYLILRVIEDEYPVEAGSLSALLEKHEIDAEDMSTDVSTPAGWAQKHSKRILSYIETDGWNSVGDLTRKNYRQKFSDPTGYKPVNNADLLPSELVKPLRWQPLTQENDGRGRFTSQVHVMPHVGVLAKPLVISEKELMNRNVSSPYMNPDMMGTVSKKDRKTLNKLIEELFEMSRKLTLKQRVLANWWDNKLFSVGRFLGQYMRLLDLDIFDVYRIFLGEMMAQHDAVLIAWKEKRRHDLVRPPTIIRHLRKNRKTMAFVSEEEGVKQIMEEEWEPVIKVQPHSEFPSASAVICTASLEHTEMALAEIVGPEGIPPYEKMLPQLYLPGIKVDAPFPVRFETLQEAAKSCGESRLWAGVHFSPSVPAGTKLGKGLGAVALKHMSDLVGGKIPNPCDRCGKF